MTMPRLRSCRRYVTALFAVLALLFAQMALADYVCPGDSKVAMASLMPSGAPCDGMDTAQPVLCHQHAADSAQTFEKVNAATPTLPLIVQVLVIPAMTQAAQAMALPVVAVPEARPPPHPLFLSTLRLRV